MKTWSLRTVLITGLAISIGLIFRWIYPLVEISIGLAVLFVVVGLVITTGAEKLYHLVKKTRA